MIEHRNTLKISFPSPFCLLLALLAQRFFEDFSFQLCRQTQKCYFLSILHRKEHDKSVI